MKGSPHGKRQRHHTRVGRRVPWCVRSDRVQEVRTVLAGRGRTRNLPSMRNTAGRPARRGLRPSTEPDGIAQPSRPDRPMHPLRLSLSQAMATSPVPAVQTAAQSGPTKGHSPIEASAPNRRLLLTRLQSQTPLPGKARPERDGLFFYAAIAACAGSIAISTSGSSSRVIASRICAAVRWIRSSDCINVLRSPR